MKDILLKHKLNSCYVIASLVITLAMIMMSKVNFTTIYGTVKENYIKTFNIVHTIIIGCLLFWVVYVSFKIFDFILSKYCNRINSKKKWKNFNLALVISIILIVFWLPYYLSYYPGGIYSDTFNAIWQIQTHNYSNHHPLLYTFLIKIVIKIATILGEDLNFALGLFLAAQMMGMGATIIYFGIWMNKHNVRKGTLNICLVYLICFPLIPLNAISIWKDTPFAIAVLLYALSSIDLFVDKNALRENYKLLIRHCVCILGVTFTRNNGIYIVIASTLLYIIFLNGDYINKTYKKLVFSFSVIGIIITLLIQGPVYSLMGISKSEVEESLGIPIQQIARVVALDGNINPKQKEQINKIVPIDEIKEEYRPCIVDPIKWNEKFDGEYLEEHKLEFINLWGALMVQNFDIYVEAYMLATAGFWCINVASPDAYIQNYVWPNGYGVTQHDYFEDFFGISFQNLVNPKKYISSAWFFWIFIISMALSIKRGGMKVICLYAPILFIWVTIMIATPLAISMRYIFGMVFGLPLAFVLPQFFENYSCNNV